MDQRLLALFALLLGSAAAAKPRVTNNRGRAVVTVDPSGCKEPATTGFTWSVNLGADFMIAAVNLQGVDISSSGQSFQVLLSNGTYSAGVLCATVPLTKNSPSNRADCLQPTRARFVNVTASGVNGMGVCAIQLTTMNVYNRAIAPALSPDSDAEILSPLPSEADRPSQLGHASLAPSQPLNLPGPTPSSNQQALAPGQSLAYSPMTAAPLVQQAASPYYLAPAPEVLPAQTPYALAPGPVLYKQHIPAASHIVSTPMIPLPAGPGVVPAPALQAAAHTPAAVRAPLMAPTADVPSPGSASALAPSPGQASALLPSPAQMPAAASSLIQAPGVAPMPVEIPSPALSLTDAPAPVPMEGLAVVAASSGQVPAVVPSTQTTAAPLPAPLSVDSAPALQPVAGPREAPVQREAVVSSATLETPPPPGGTPSPPLSTSPPPTSISQWMNAPTPPPLPPSASRADTQSSTGLGTGGIAGIAIGATVAVLVAVALIAMIASRFATPAARPYPSKFDSI